jgi:DNA-binding FadR family transcriptional regulator
MTETAELEANRNVVQELVDYVRRQGLSRGDRLPSIRQLADSLDLGRNVVRDALMQAQTLGLVKIEPRLGIFVQNPEIVAPADGAAFLESEEQNVFHLIDARLLVEVELVGLATQAQRPEDLLPLRQALDVVLQCQGDRRTFIEADEAFHLSIARVAGNPVLRSFLRSLFIQLRPAKMGVLLTPQDRQQTDQEHIDLFRSILERDADRARTALRTHLMKGRSLLLQRLHTLPEITVPVRESDRLTASPASLVP